MREGSTKASAGRTGILIGGTDRGSVVVAGRIIKLARFLPVREAKAHHV